MQHAGEKAGPAGIKPLTYDILVGGDSHGLLKQMGEVVFAYMEVRGQPVQQITAPADGWLFTLREYPACYAGSVVARLMLGGAVF